MDIRPTFVGYRQLVDGIGFPAYARVEDTLHFQVEAIRLREVVKFTGYKRAGTGRCGSGEAHCKLVGRLIGTQRGT